ncbi:MAG: STAS domain-containing protein [Candidatus Ozemobacteraceae bacterium]
MPHKLEKIKNAEKPNTWFLQLEGEATLAQAIDLKNLFREGLKVADCLHIELSRLSTVDLSFLQLLCSLHLTARKAGKTVLLVGNMPQIMRDIAMQAGFPREKGCVEDSASACFWVGDCQR